jgi:hypothetical protein
VSILHPRTSGGKQDSQGVSVDGERVEREPTGGLGAEPPVGSRGFAPGGGQGGFAPLKLETFAQVTSKISH